MPAKNPPMKIPVLVTDNSDVLFGSPVMCGYLDGLVGVGKSFPAGRARRPAPRQQALGDGTLDALILRR